MFVLGFNEPDYRVKIFPLRVGEFMGKCNEEVMKESILKMSKHNTINDFTVDKRNETMVIPN